jgi:hypothetical protein
VSKLSTTVALEPPAVLTCAMAEASARFVSDHAAPLAERSSRGLPASSRPRPMSAARATVHKSSPSMPSPMHSTGARSSLPTERGSRSAPGMQGRSRAGSRCFQASGRRHAARLRPFSAPDRTPTTPIISISTWRSGAIRSASETPPHLRHRGKGGR